MQQKNAIRVLVSYRHESTEHVERVLGLCNQLRRDGIDAVCDRYVAAPAEGWSWWMEHELANANRVIIVCSLSYLASAAREAIPNQGLGSSWEWHLIRKEFYNSRGGGERIVPVYFDPIDEKSIPQEAWDRPKYCLTDLDGVQYGRLLNDLLRQPDIEAPPLGTAVSLESGHVEAKDVKSAGAISSGKKSPSRVSEKITKLVNERVAFRASRLLDFYCKTYVMPVLSRRTSKRDERGKHDEKRFPLNAETMKLMLGQGTNESKRVRIFAESGYGKTTLLIEIERQVAAAGGTLIPLRVGAGPADVKEVDGKPVLLPLISSINWKAEPRILAAVLFRRLLKPILADAVAESEGVEWLLHELDRGNLLFLMDSTDQSRGDLEPLAEFLAENSQCTAYLTGRPDTREFKAEVYAHDFWDTIWVDEFNEEQIRLYCQNNKIADLLWARDDWRPLVTVPILLRQLKNLATHGQLSQLKNREAVYEASLTQLVLHGKHSLNSAFAEKNWTRQLERIQSVLAQAAWWTITLEGEVRDKDENFTGRLDGDAFREFQVRFEKEFGHDIQTLWQLDIATMAYIEVEGQLSSTLAWRHASFVEWFAAMQFVSLNCTEIDTIIQAHGNDARFVSVFRYALCIADRRKLLPIKRQILTSLMSSGALRTVADAIDKDRIAVDHTCLPLKQLLDWLCEEELYVDMPSHELCSQLVNPDVVHVLCQVFDREKRSPHIVYRAWKLLESSSLQYSTPQLKSDLEKIRNNFLSEFEAIVADAISRRLTPISEWPTVDSQALRLIPDEELAEARIISKDTLAQMREWPTKDQGYYAQRLTFRRVSCGLQPNFCLCPPRNWRHPTDPEQPPTVAWLGSNVTPQDLPRQRVDVQKPFLIGAAPVTVGQYKLFCPSWGPATKEVQNSEQSEYPATHVDRKAAVIFAIWLTGHGRYGKFQLPHQLIWEFACRGGRDAENEHFGVGDGDFSNLSLRHANFTSLGSVFLFEEGTSEKGLRNRSTGGMRAVRSYPPNDFGLFDCHGQVSEVVANMVEYRPSTPEGIVDDYGDGQDFYVAAKDRGLSFVIRMGGSYESAAINCRSSSLDIGPDIATSTSGFRLAVIPNEELAKGDSDV